MSKLRIGQLAPSSVSLFRARGRQLLMSGLGLISRFLSRLQAVWLRLPSHQAKAARSSHYKTWSWLRRLTL